jgi:hypothetical protein
MTMHIEEGKKNADSESNSAAQKGLPFMFTRPSIIISIMSKDCFVPLLAYANAISSDQQDGSFNENMILSQVIYTRIRPPPPMTTNLNFQ